MKEDTNTILEQIVDKKLESSRWLMRNDLYGKLLFCRGYDE